MFLLDVFTILNHNNNNNNNNNNFITVMNFPRYTVYFGYTAAMSRNDVAKICICGTTLKIVRSTCSNLLSIRQVISILDIYACMGLTNADTCMPSLGV